MCCTLRSSSHAQISIFCRFTVKETISAFSLSGVKQKPQTDLEGWAAPVWGGCEGPELIVVTEDKCLGDHLHL